MTIEKLITIVNECGLLEVEDLKKFFESHVCIPKGENCHPYHMELHQWAENPLKDLPVFNEEHGIFYLSILDEYRIKPSEPVYEWQWYRIHNGEVYMNAKGFYTQEEANTWGRQYFKFEETKRERK